jgi:hypothetical protein
VWTAAEQHHSLCLLLGPSQGEEGGPDPHQRYQPAGESHNITLLVIIYYIFHDITSVSFSQHWQKVPWNTIYFPAPHRVKKVDLILISAISQLVSQQW